MGAARLNRIVGIVLVKNEEFFVSWAIESVAGFCDRIVVLDNRSSDATPERLAALQRRHANVEVHRIDDPNRSHRYIQGYAGTPTWVFGVDGDEVYDSAGLARLRPRIVAGELDAHWRIGGHMLNPTAVDLRKGSASGYGTPSTPSVTKLFNFGALESWVEPCRQRLHGSSMAFRPGYSRRAVLKLYEEQSWEQCDFRCLHLCFFPRSSGSTVSPVQRENPSQVKARGPRRTLERVKAFLRHPLLRHSGYKTRRYRRGPVLTRDISAFGSPPVFGFPARGPRARSSIAPVERVLATQAATHG